MSEPTEDGTIVRTGDRHPYTFWERDAEVSREAGWPHGQWWWDASDDEREPVLWLNICGLGNLMLVTFQPLELS